MLWRFQRAAFLFLLPLIARPQSGLIQVTAVRSWSHPDSTRVIIETSGSFEYKTDRAVNPDRFFIDILHARPWIERRRIASHPVNGTLVQRVRVAETSPGVTRIVFDLAGASEHSITTLHTPDRLIVDFRPVGRKAPAARPAGIPTLSRSMPRGRKFVPPPPRPPEPLAVIALPPALPAETSAPEFADLTSVRLLIPALPAPKAPAMTAARRVTEGTLSTTKVLPPVRPAAPTPSAKARPPDYAARSLTRALGLKINRVVIDAGHGGHDEGTVGPNGVREKDVVLDVALRVAALVQTRLGAEVVLTRSEDTFVPLQDRTALANQHKADLFLSIHANSSPSPAVAGTETFLLNFTSSPGALDVAARENAGSDKSVGELKDLVQQISLNDKIAESQTFAGMIEKSLALQAGRGNPAAKDRGVKRAPFVVLIGASMPSILAEIGFLSNAVDEANLGKPDYRQKVAEALFKGVSQYSQSLSHFEEAADSSALASSLRK